MGEPRMQAAQTSRHTAAAMQLGKHTALCPRRRSLACEPTRPELFGDDTMDRLGAPCADALKQFGGKELARSLRARQCL